MLNYFTIWLYFKITLRYWRCTFCASKKSMAIYPGLTLIPSRSIRILADMFHVDSSLRKRLSWDLARVRSRDLDYSRKAISSSSFGGAFLSQPRYPSPFAIPFLANPTLAAIVLVSTGKFSRLRVASPVSGILPLLVARMSLVLSVAMLFKAQWYPAHETVLYWRISPLALFYCWKCPPDRCAYHYHRRHPPPADLPKPCVCPNHQFHYQPPTSFFFAEWSAVVICIWKPSKIGRALEREHAFIDREFVALCIKFRLTFLVKDTPWLGTKPGRLLLLI